MPLFASCQEEVFSETQGDRGKKRAKAKPPGPLLACDLLAVLLGHLLHCLPRSPPQVFWNHRGLHMDGCAHSQ